MLPENEFLNVHCEQMDEGRMREFIKENGFDFVIDATHPYAVKASANIKEAVKDLNVQRIRLKRVISGNASLDGVRFFDTHEDCAKALCAMTGRILLTIGCRELSKYCENEDLKERLIVRIIPDEDSLRCCRELGIKGKNIIAMQGPFSLSMNEAMIEMYGIAAMVSKQSGTAGGFDEKMIAANHTGIPLFVIGKAEEEAGALTLSEVKELLQDELGIRPENNSAHSEEEDFERQKVFVKESENKEESNIQKEITLAGIGMGSIGNCTTDVVKSVEKADLLFGAKRMLASFPESKAEKVPLYTAEEILNYIKNHPEYQRIVVLFSGDSGFYSGAKKLADALKKELDANALKSKQNADALNPEMNNGRTLIKILPGISSVSYLSSKCGISYEDALILSMHGKELVNIAKKVRNHKKIFLLLSGSEDIRFIGQKLQKAGLDEVKITIGFNLSYEDEKILTMNPEECSTFDEKGIFTACIENDNPVFDILTPGLENEAFLREKVPMTKEEVREVSITKLRLKKDSILYDIGSGTGSISVEAAGLSDDIKVFAIEQKEEAVNLTGKNAEKFNLENIQIIHAKAPDGLKQLPKATHAFIGGSGGNLREIIECLYEINPRMRVVINAISLETLSEIKEILKLPYVTNPDVVLAQFSHAKNVLDYNLMTSDNPVWICAFDFK